MNVTNLVIATADGTPEVDASTDAVLSPDGSTITFWSIADNSAVEDGKDCPPDKLTEDAVRWTFTTLRLAR